MGLFQAAQYMDNWDPEGEKQERGGTEQIFEEMTGKISKHNENYNLTNSRSSVNPENKKYEKQQQNSKAHHHQVAQN